MSTLSHDTQTQDLTCRAICCTRCPTINLYHGSKPTPENGILCRGCGALNYLHPGQTEWILTKERYRDLPQLEERLREKRMGPPRYDFEPNYEQNLRRARTETREEGGGFGMIFDKFMARRPHVALIGGQPTAPIYEQVKADRMERDPDFAEYVQASRVSGSNKRYAKTRQNPIWETITSLFWSFWV